MKKGCERENVQMSTLTLLPDQGGFSVGIPDGMVLIPGGINSGMDLDDGAYSLTVDTFHMDATEVTKAQRDTIYNWAVQNGHSFFNRGSGKAGNKP